MDIKLDVSVLESTACAYRRAHEEFMQTREAVRLSSVQLGLGWQSSAYLCFQQECSYMLSSVYAPGVEGLQQASAALVLAAEKAKTLQGSACAIAGVLGGEVPGETGTLCYCGADADDIRQRAAYVSEDLTALEASVTSALSSVYLETTSCDLGEWELRTLVADRKAKVSKLELRLTFFELRLSMLGQGMDAIAPESSEVGVLVVGGVRGIYAGGVLNLELVRQLMSVPPGMLTPTELAALSGTLEMIMGEAMVNLNTLDQEKVSLLADFLGACYGQGKAISAGREGHDEALMEFKLQPSFASLVSFMEGADNNTNRATVSTWLQGVTYNASTVRLLGNTTSVPDIKIRSAGDFASIETYYDNCLSGRSYVMNDGALYLETDRDLRFIVSRTTNPSEKTFDEFIKADVFTDSSGRNKVVAEQVFEYLGANIDPAEVAGGFVAEKVFEEVTSIKSPIAFDLIKGGLFLLQIKDAVDLDNDRTQASQQLAQDLEYQKSQWAGNDNMNACLNADGTVAIREKK